MNNSRLVFKQFKQEENINDNLVYTLSSSECVQLECGNRITNLNIIRQPPVFNLNAPPDPLLLLSHDELDSLDLASSKSSISNNSATNRPHTFQLNPDKFLLHLLSVDNKIEQCIDLRLQIASLGLKKYNHDTSQLITNNKLKQQDLTTGFNTNNNNNKQMNRVSNRLYTPKQPTTISAKPTNDLFLLVQNPQNNNKYNDNNNASQTSLNPNLTGIDNSSNSSLIHFVLLAFMSLVCLLLILVIFYFLFQRKKFSKKALSITNPLMSNNTHQLEHLYNHHHLQHLPMSLKDPNLSSLERSSASSSNHNNSSYNMNQLQHLLIKQQLQLQNEMNIQQYVQQTNSNHSSGMPVSTSLLTFDWLSLAKHSTCNPNSKDNNLADNKTNKKLAKKYSDTSRKSTNSNQQNEMKILKQPLLDTAGCCNMNAANAANSTLSTRATATASSSSSSSSSVSSAIIKTDSINHYQKLYPKSNNHEYLINQNNYSMGSPNEIGPNYNSLMLQNFNNGTLLNNNKSCSFNKVALLCNSNDPNAPPQLIKIMNLNEENSTICDYLQVINLEAAKNNMTQTMNPNNSLFETNHYENFRDSKRFSRLVMEPSGIIKPAPVENEQFYELIDDNILSGNLNLYNDWNTKNNKTNNDKNLSMLRPNHSFSTKRKYPKTNPNYSQSNYVSVKNNTNNKNFNELNS